MKNYALRAGSRLALILLVSLSAGLARGQTPFSLGSEEKATRYDLEPSFLPNPPATRAPGSRPYDFSPAGRVLQLNDLVTLSSEQKTGAIWIFTEEKNALDARPRADRGERGAPFRQSSRAHIRALLNAHQQAIYDRTPQIQGGGLTLPTPEIKLTRLEANTALTRDQEKQALQIYRDEFEALVALPPDDRPTKGVPFRQTAQKQIEALLGKTPAAN